MHETKQKQPTFNGSYQAGTKMYECPIFQNICITAEVFIKDWNTYPQHTSSVTYNKTFQNLTLLI